MGRRIRSIAAILVVLIGLVFLMSDQIKFVPKKKAKIECETIESLLVKPCSVGNKLLSFSDHPYNVYIVANRSGVCPQLVYAVMQCESGLDSLALSPVGAKGLMQLMPCIYGDSDPYNPAANIAMGTAFLHELILRYDNDIWLAVAAYNCGPRHVDRVQGIPEIEETQKFVKAVKKKYRGKHVK